MMFELRPRPKAALFRLRQRMASLDLTISRGAADLAQRVLEETQFAGDVPYGVALRMVAEIGRYR